MINLKYFRLAKSPKTVDHDMTVIIRGAGERTESICLKLVSQQINSRNVHLINEVPFSAALKKSYQIGIKEGRKWTTVIDADVLIRSNLLNDLYARAESAPRSVFAVQTEMLDKFFGGIRVGGVKVYRTKLLKKAVKLAPTINVRPEAFVIKNMHANGFYVDITDLVCGTHDFEQYYGDIYRKGFTHGIKHASLANLLMPYWKRMVKKDKDFEVLLAGFQIGTKHTKDLELDKNEVKSEFKKFVGSRGLKEKPALKSNISLGDINQLLNDFIPPKEYEAVKLAIDKMGRPEVPKNAR